ncbi:hypothetical protein M433DRAFT_8822 [Acidomyces richmondensis BFW]|nr:hypothetical protein M433DRAFT_8822 [Acidomyces richmondensis BFW]
MRRRLIISLKSTDLSVIVAGYGVAAISSTLLVKQRYLAAIVRPLQRRLRTLQLKSLNCNSGDEKGLLRCERFESLQQRLIAPNRPDGKKETYELIKDVETRWNSFYYSAERACYLRPAIDELLEEEAVEYDKYTRRCTTSNRLAVITRYVEILKPLKDATMALEGHIGGRFGAIWRVLPQYERILHHFEGLVNQYPIHESLRQQQLPSNITFDTSNTFTTDSLSALPNTSFTAEHHFSINIKLA